MQEIYLNHVRLATISISGMFLYWGFQGSGTHLWSSSTQPPFRAPPARLQPVPSPTNARQLKSGRVCGGCHLAAECHDRRRISWRRSSCHHSPGGATGLSLVLRRSPIVEDEAVEVVVEETPVKAGLPQVACHHATTQQSEAARSIGQYR